MAEEIAQNSSLSFFLVARNTAWYFFALTAQKALSFFYFSYLARRIGVSDTGVYALVLSYTAFFGVLVDLGVSQVIIRELSQNFERIKKWGSSLLLFRFLSGILIGGAGYFLAPLFGLGDYKSLILLGIIIMFFDSLSLFFYSILRASQNLKYESFGVIAFQIILVSVGLTFLIRGEAKLEYLISAIIVASVFGFLYSFLTVLKKTNLRFIFAFDQLHASEIKRMLKSALFFFATGLMIKLYNVQDLLIINKFTDANVLGLYALPAKVMFTWPFLAMAFSGSMYPALSHYFSHDKLRFKKLFLRYSGLMLLISVLLSAVLYFKAEFLLGRIWPEYMESLRVWKYLALGLPLLFIEFPLGAVLNASHHEKWNSFNRMIHVVLAVVLNLALIPVYGLNGALISFFAANSVLVGLGLYKSIKIVTGK